MAERAVTSWMAALGTEVLDRAVEMTRAMDRKERVVSLPPEDDLERRDR